MDISYDLIFFTLVSMRLTGCIIFNPILGRRNLPMSLKAGLILILTLLVCSVTPMQAIEVVGLLHFFVLVAKELLIGFIIGLIVRMFFAVVSVGGEVIDMQIGLSMAKAYDSQSESNSTITASLLNIMYMMIFIAANGHATLIQIFVELAKALPYDEFIINIASFETVIRLFSLILIYSVKLALPILGVSLVTEVGVGLLMKAVPQINVFVINLQLKVLLGLVSIWLLVPTFANFFDRMTILIFDQIHGIMGV